MNLSDTVLSNVYLNYCFQGSIAKKPYNPIIGETFHCSWVLPSSGDASTTTDTAVSAEDQTEGNADHTGDRESGEEGDSSISENGRVVEEGRTLYFCAEQVSHHPPSKSSVNDFT